MTVAFVLATVTPPTAQELAPALAQRFNEGVRALKAGELDSAESAFRDVLSAGGTRPFVYLNLGIALQQRGRHAEALDQFWVATRLDRTLGPARLLAGVSLIALGRSSDAVAELKHAVVLMPDELSARLQLAEACELTGNVVCVVDALRVVGALAPANEEYAYRLGKAYLRLSQWAHERIRAIDPKSARLQQALGREYLQQGQSQLAEQAFLEASLLDASLPEVHLALAQIYLADGRLDEAGRAAAREIVIVPDSRAARELLDRITAARNAR